MNKIKNFLNSKLQIPKFTFISIIVIIILIFMVIAVIAFNVGKGTELINTNSQINEFKNTWDSRYIKLDDRLSAVESKTNDLNSVKKDLENLKNDLNKSTETSPSEELKTSATQNNPVDISKIKESFKKLLEESYNATLTKMIFDEDKQTFYIAYNTKWGSEGTITKEIFELTSGFAQSDYLFNYDFTATNTLGDNFHAYTSKDLMLKIKNMEMSYEDWLREAYKK